MAGPLDFDALRAAGLPEEAARSVAQIAPALLSDDFLQIGDALDALTLAHGRDVLDGIRAQLPAVPTRSRVRLETALDLLDLADAR